MKIHYVKQQCSKQSKASKVFHFWVCLFLLLFPFSIQAQVAPCELGDCDCLLQKAETLIKQKQYPAALKKYYAAEVCLEDAGKAHDIPKRIAALFEKIDQLRNEAQRNLARAEQEKKRALAAETEARHQRDTALFARTQAETAQKEAQNNLAKVNKLLNAFYFYADRFALAYNYDGKQNESNFYFIDKNGNEVNRLGHWEKAELFDDTGLAKLKKNTTEYLSDTIRAYKLAYTLEELDNSVEALDLMDIALDTFPKSILEHPQLKIVFLKGSVKKQMVIPKKIENLKQLKHLSFKDCNIIELPREIGQLQNLIRLDLAGNQLNRLPIEISQLQNLTYLNLAGNHLDSLPAKFGQLRNLIELDLSENLLKDLTTAITQLNNLTSLDLSGNQFHILPPQIKYLYSLKKLDLAGNQLKSLPIEIGQLQNLTYLDLKKHDRNSLKVNLPNNLQGNQLDSIPAEIGQLRNLTYLDLSGNQLITLPPEIKELHSLTELNISDGEYNKLLREIGNSIYRDSYLAFELMKRFGLEVEDILKLKAEVFAFEFAHRNRESNMITKSEKEKIQRLLPNCNITF